MKRIPAWRVSCVFDLKKTSKRQSNTRTPHVDMYIDVQATMSVHGRHSALTDTLHVHAGALETAAPLEAPIHRGQQVSALR